MEENRGKIYAVLTGDIVRSKKLSSEDFQLVKDCLRKTVKNLNHLGQGRIVKGSIDFYRGDGWQLLLTAPKYALRASLFIRACMIAHSRNDSRIAVGIGRVSNINSDKISQSMGEAFELSGRALDQLKGRRRMAIALPYYREEENDWLLTVYELCDAIAQKWTQRQAEAMSWALRNYKQKEIASRVRPQRTLQNIGNILRNSGWYALESAINRLELKTQKY